MSPKTIESLLKILFFVVSAMYLYVVFMGFNNLKPFFISLPVITLGFLYLLKIKKKDKLILMAFVLTIIGATLSPFEEFYLIATSFFFIEHLLFIKLIIGYIKPKKRGIIPSVILLFLLFFIVLFLLIYGGTEKNIGYTVVLVYGFVSFSLTAMAFANFLQKKNKANFLLLTGFFISITSDCVYAIGLLDKNSFYYVFLGEFLYWFSYAMIYVGFIEKNKRG